MLTKMFFFIFIFCVCTILKYVLDIVLNLLSKEPKKLEYNNKEQLIIATAISYILTYLL
jgi:hypothetical protein